jgi:kynurenine formamidase
MDINMVADYLVNSRLVDLSLKVNPGGAGSPFGAPPRRYEIKQFDYAPVKPWSGPGETMHYIDMENHISTHVECPSHFIPARHGRSAPDLSEVPLSSFFGMATFVNGKDFKPKTAIDTAVLKRFPIQERDIVLLGNCRTGLKGEERSYMTKDAAEYLLTKRVKLVGFDDTVIPENPLILKDLKTAFTHDLMLSNGIPIIERLANMDKLTKPRFLFFCFPAKMGGLDSFPIRAVAIEGRD